MVSFPTLIGTSLSPSAASFYSDSYVQFTAYAEYDDGHHTALTPSQVTFTTSDPSVATTNYMWSGRVYGVAAGTCVLTAHHRGHPFAYDATATLTVTAPPPPPPPPEARFSLAFGASTTEAYPAWTAIDAHPNLVTSYSIDRGRSYELDQTDAGRATVTITDPDGILDPTNPTGPYHGQLRPLLPAVLCRQNPVTDAWEERYRGYVEDYTYDIDPSQRVNRLVISLTDLFEIAASAEMHPGQFGANVNGQVSYSPQRVDQRIATILTDLGIPRRLWVTLTSSVQLQGATYSAGENPLSAIQEAADGEFPNVANVFTDRHGRMCFLGRRARFDPSGTAALADDSWDYHAWKAGDGAAVTASPSDTAQVRALGFQRGLSKIINTATATEAGAPDEEIPDRRVTDPGSVNTYGIRSWSASNLPILEGDSDRTYPTSGATETHRFAEYFVANYAQPRDRITAISFRSLHPDDPRAAANWDLLSRVDIGDTIMVTVHAAGGGGFVAEGYFVEGVHEDTKPLAPGYDDVTVTLDLSPRAYYAVDPWATPLTEADPTIPDTIDANPVRRSRHPRPTTHARDHEHDGADPIRTHYEKVGTEAGTPGDGGGTIDPTGYIRYTTDNEGGWLDIGTTDVVPTSEPDPPFRPYGTRFHAPPGGSSDQTRIVGIEASGDGPFVVPLTLHAEGTYVNAGAQRGLDVLAEGPGAIGIVASGTQSGIAVTQAGGTGITVNVTAGEGLDIHLNTGIGLRVTFGTGSSLLNTFEVTDAGVFVGGHRVLTA